MYLCIASDVNLTSKILREQWESEFYQVCVQPVLQDVQKSYQQALSLIANDDSQGGKPIQLPVVL